MDVVGVLTKVFVKIHEIRDAKSEINVLPGLPDPTFGIGPETNSTLDLAVQELGRSFSIECQNIGYDFSDIYDETRIGNSLCYKRYIQRVVDLVQINQITAAGQVLIALVSEAANVALSKPGKIEKNYRNLIKTLERMCSYYILEFAGQARADLIVLCQNLNKTLKIDSSHSCWVKFPPISQLFQFDSVKEPGIMNASQTSMFYDPLCVSVVPDAGPEFHELLTNEASTVPSISYNEPLPLMFLRFESMRRLNNADGAQKRLLSLGVVILRKLLQATQQFSILYQQDMYSTQKGNKIFCIWRRQNTSDNGVNKLRSDGTAGALTSYTNMENSPDNALDEGGEANDMLVEVSNILVGEPKPSWLHNLDIKPGCTNARISEMLNSDDNPKLRPDWDNLSEETLSFCTGYMCNFLYQVTGFHKYLKQTDKDVLVLATLRSLELSRYRTDVRKRDTISDKEHAFLQSLEQNLFDCYRKHIEGIKLVEPHVLKGLERLYMKKLCLCNTGRDCFFNFVVPLSLISFLVKRQLTDHNIPEEKRPGRNLALYTLCHSNKPLLYYMYPAGSANTYTNYCLRNFKDIAKRLLDHLTDLPEGHFYLNKLLDHYSKVRDGEAMFCLLDELQNLQGRSISRETPFACLKFILNCIEYDNNVDGIFSRSRPHIVCNTMNSLCIMLRLEFVMTVLDRWKELVKFYGDNQLKSLVGRMSHYVLQRDSPQTDKLLSLISKYFSGKFEHDIRSCITLQLIDNDDESLEKVFDIIQQNEDNFTAEALSAIAQNKRMLAEKKRRLAEEEKRALTEKKRRLAEKKRRLAEKKRRLAEKKITLAEQKWNQRYIRCLRYTAERILCCGVVFVVVWLFLVWFFCFIGQKYNRLQ